MQRVPVVLFGCGVVGKGVLRQSLTAASTLRSRHGVELSVRMVVESDGAVSAPGGLPIERVLEWKKAGRRLVDMPDVTAVRGAAAASQAALAICNEGGVLVDCTATDAVTPLIRQWMERGGGVALANKRPVSGPQADFDAFTSPAAGPRFGYESTVGAGTPFVAAVRRVVAAGDKVDRIAGAFSGTLGFLSAGLEQGKPMGALVKEAHALGYTEPDPRDDLSGMDVARKALILARTAGWQFELSDVEVESLFPASMASLSIPEFMAAIHTTDAAIESRRQEAMAQGAVLRYVAQISSSGCRVGLVPIPKTSAIGKLEGTDNIMQLNTAIYKNNPLVIQGAGAGDLITACGIISDIVAMAPVLRR